MGSSQSTCEAINFNFKLVVQGKPLYFWPRIMAEKSPYFAKILYDEDLNEKEMAVVEILDEKYSDVKEMFEVVCSVPPKSITAANCAAMLHLADRFEIISLANTVLKFVNNESEFKLSNFYKNQASDLLKVAEEVKLHETDKESVGKIVTLFADGDYEKTLFWADRLNLPSVYLNSVDFIKSADFTLGNFKDHSKAISLLKVADKIRFKEKECLAKLIRLVSQLDYQKLKQSGIFNDLSRDASLALMRATVISSFLPSRKSLCNGHVFAQTASITSQQYKCCGRQCWACTLCGTTSNGGVLAYCPQCSSFLYHGCPVTQDQPLPNCHKSQDAVVDMDFVPRSFIS